MKISRQAYADMFGPTVGDKVRLADANLWIEVEKDFTLADLPKECRAVLSAP